MTNRRPELPVQAHLPEDHPGAALALGDAALQRLETFLAAIPSGEAMTLEELDGFLAALAVCPAPVSQQTMIDEIVGAPSHGTSWFKNSAEQGEILGLIERHRQSIDVTLAQDLPYFPLVLGFDDEQPSGHGWAMGFMRGVGLTEQAWDYLLDDDEIGEALDPIILLADEADPDPSEPSIELSADERDQVFRDIADGLPAMYQWFQENAVRRRSSARRPGGGQRRR